MFIAHSKPKRNQNEPHRTEFVLLCSYRAKMPLFVGSILRIWLILYFYALLRDRILPITEIVREEDNSFQLWINSLSERTKFTCRKRMNAVQRQLARENFLLTRKNSKNFNFELNKAGTKKFNRCQWLLVATNTVCL